MQSSVYPVSQCPAASSRPVRLDSSRRASRQAANLGCSCSSSRMSGSLARAKRFEKPWLHSVRKRCAQLLDGATPISKQRACTAHSAASTLSSVRFSGSSRSSPIASHCNTARGNV